MNNIGSSPPKVILFDLWKTLVTSHCSEPVWNAQKIIGHGVGVSESGENTLQPDDEFLRYALTTNITDPARFLEHAARHFKGALNAESLAQFAKVLSGESGCAARFLDVDEVLAELSRRKFPESDRGRYRLGLVSNLWAFPVKHIFEENGLGAYFEHLIYSFEVGYRKPEPEIFLEAARRFGVEPHECLMIGDNLTADIKGALDVGMRAALIDRLGDVKPEVLEATFPGRGVLHLRSLKDLLTQLP